MFGKILTDISGIATYPMFSLLVFFIFFLITFLWVLKTGKNEFRQQSMLPLSNDSTDENYEK